MALISAKDYLNGGKASADEKQNTGLVSATDFLNEKYKPRDMLSPDQFNAKHGLDLIHPMQIMAPNSPLSQALQKKTEQPKKKEDASKPKRFMDNPLSYIFDHVDDFLSPAEGLATRELTGNPKISTIDALNAPFAWGAQKAASLPYLDGRTDDKGYHSLGERMAADSPATTGNATFDKFAQTAGDFIAPFYGMQGAPLNIATSNPVQQIASRVASRAGSGLGGRAARSATALGIEGAYQGFGGELATDTNPTLGKLATSTALGGVLGAGLGAGGEALGPGLKKLAGTRIRHNPSQAARASRPSDPEIQTYLEAERAHLRSPLDDPNGYALREIQLSKWDDLVKKYGSEERAQEAIVQYEQSPAPQTGSSVPAQPTLGFSAFGKRQPERYVNPSDAHSIGQLIDVGGRPAREGNSLSKAYTATVDELHPLNQATKALGGKDVPIEQNPYEQAWLSRGWRGKADTALEYGFIDEAGNKVASGLKEAIQPVSGALDDWRKYAVALRSLEYERDGLVSGVPKALAEKTIAELGSKPEVIAAQKQIRQYIDDMNNATLVKSGVRSAEQQAKLSEEHPNYIPMFRTREKGIRDVPQSASNKRFGNQKDPAKKRSGSVKPIVDPLESIVKQTYKNTAISEKNNVMRTLVELAEKNPENSIIRPVTAEESALSQTQKALDDFLMNPTDNLEKGLTDALDLFTPKNVGGKKNVFTVMRDGKAEQWEVLDNELAKTIAGLNNESVGVLANLLGKPTGVLKAGLVLAPDFLFKNLVRDQLSAFINSKYGFIPIWDMMRGLSSAIKKDDAFYQWMASGGANGAWVSLERDYLQGQIRKLTRQGMQKMPKNPVEWLRVLSEVSEQSTRIGEFKRGVKATGNLQEAALASRDVTLDFSRSGSKTKGINKAVAFFNVAVQSIDKTVRQFKARPGQTFAKAVTAITLPSVLLYLKNHNDPRYQELPQWEKDTYWHFFAGDTTFRIPKPFELGVIFGTYPERQLQAMMESDPAAFEGFAKTVVDGFTPSVMPTLFMPWVEAFANKKTFTGAPIVPKREEGLEAQDQYGPYTSEVGKMVGQVTNTSPRIVDNYILGYTGTLGKYALNNADRALAQAGVADPVPKADQGLAGTPIIRSFVSKGLEGSSKSVDDFYKEKDKLSREQASAKKNVSENDNAGKLQMYNMIGGYISDLQKQSQSVLEDRTMTPQEKRDKLKDINLNITNLARSAKGLAPIE